MAAQPERWNARRMPPRLPGPTYPGPRCGVDVASRFRGFRVENLRHVGWQLFMPATYVLLPGVTRVVSEQTTEERGA